MTISAAGWSRSLAPRCAAPTPSRTDTQDPAQVSDGRLVYLSSGGLLRAAASFLLSWYAPRPGGRRPQAEPEAAMPAASVRSSRRLSARPPPASFALSRGGAVEAPSRGVSRSPRRSSSEGAIPPSRPAVAYLQSLKTRAFSAARCRTCPRGSTRSRRGRSLISLGDRRRRWRIQASAPAQVRPTHPRRFPSGRF